MSGMADKSAGDRPARQRIKTLTQAAMNADVTVNQLEDVLGGLGDTLGDLNTSLTNLNNAVDRLDNGLDHFEATLGRIDDLMKRLFTFSATGIESFYSLPEDKASKGVADYLMLRRKLPDEMFDGRRVLPGTLFRRDDVAGYLANLHRALDETIDELGSSGSVDVFG